MILCALLAAGCSEGTSPKSAPTVLSISPSSGPLAGGTSVTITGANFLNVTSVTIGGNALTNLSVASGTQATGQTAVSTSSGATDVVVNSSSHGSGRCTGCFTYNPVVTVTSVTSNNGPLAGGTSVTITGTNFVNVTAVTIGGSPLANVSIVSSTQLTGQTPAAASNGARDVTVSSSSHGAGSCVGCYTYNPVMTVSGVSPNNGPLAGATTVIISGTNFPATIDSVRIGTGWLGNLTRLSGTQVSGITPTGSAAGAMHVTIFTTNSGISGCVDCFTYNPEVTVSNINPNNGPQAGGTTVTINGANFPATIDSVRIGPGRLGSVTRVSATQLSGISPVGNTVGVTDVTVYSRNAGSGNCAACFTYNPPLTVSSVSPGDGPQLGGTTVTITGTNFLNVTAVTIGGNALTNVTVVSNTQLTALTPSGAISGPRNLVVTSSSHGSGSCVACFNYNPLPTVLSVSPSSGPLAGGTSVTITGTNFLSVTSVTIGGNALTNLSVASGTQATGQTAGTASSGATDVVVNSSSHGSGSCTGCFTYNPVVTVSAVSPSNGPLSGGTSVTITGTNFLNVTAVTIGGSPLANLSIVSSTQLTGLTPAASSNGAKDVMVSSSSHGSSTCVGCFTYNISWIGLAAGGDHTCGLSNNAEAYCWGSNVYGELGDGSRTRRLTPVAVEGGIRFARLAVGGAHTCGLTNAGKAFCWGANNDGRLGDGSTVDHATPIAVAGGLTFTSLGVAGGLAYDGLPGGGEFFSCGLTSSGDAYCWGSNQYGQLGDASTVNKTIPTAVAGGLAFASVVVGASHACALTGAGLAYCWGNNVTGQLGDGSKIDRSVPVAVAGGIEFKSLAAGGYHTCGVTSGGAAYCWGLNGNGRLGDGSTIDRSVPVPVAGGILFVTLIGGVYHTCGLASNVVSYCWGYGLYSQLGNGFPFDRTAPTEVAGGHAFASLAGGGRHTCGVTISTVAYCWGPNFSGELGDGSTNPRETPSKVSNP